MPRTPPHRPQSRSHTSPADGFPQYMPIQLPYLFAAPSIAVARVPATLPLTLFNAGMHLELALNARE